MERKRFLRELCNYEQFIDHREVLMNIIAFEGRRSEMGSTIYVIIILQTVHYTPQIR